MADVPSSISYTATGGSTPLSGITSSVTGTGGHQISITVPASTTNQLYTVAIDISELKSIFLYADGVLTVKTNDSGSPADTFVFAASGSVLVYDTNMATIDGVAPNPFDVDVTAFYLTNGTADDVNLYGFINQGTP